MIWSIIQNLGKQGINLLLFFVLAFFLNPDDFGILAMAMTWIAFMQTFAEIGLSSAIVQRKEIDNLHLSTVFFINIVVGTLLTLTGIFLAEYCAAFFNTPDVAPVMAFLSLGFLINSFSFAKLSLAIRGLCFKDIAIREITSAFLGGVFGIAAAFFGFGVWSLVIQYLSLNFLRALLFWSIVEWDPSLKDFSVTKLKDIWRYSMQICLFNLLKYFTQNIDKIIIGHILGSFALGIYTFAYKVIIYPVSMFVGSIGWYLFPRFSKLQDEIKKIKSEYILINKTMSIMLIPIIVFGTIAIPAVLKIFFDPQWIVAEPVIKILSVFALLIPLISHVGQLMKALNKLMWLNGWTVFVTLLVSILILMGANEGLNYAVSGLSLAYVISLPVNFLILHKLIDFNVKDFIHCVHPHYSVALPLGGLLLVTLRSVDSSPILLLASFFAIILYSGFIFIFEGEFIKQVWNQFSVRFRLLKT